MSQLLIVLSYWLHELATVILIGHYLLLPLIYMPVITRSSEQGLILSSISFQSRLWMYFSLILFAGTGAYLTFADPNYLGLGNFGNTWGVLMLIKHLLIVGMVGLGFWFNAVFKGGPAMNSDQGDVAVKRFHGYCWAMAIAGLLVLLLTGIAQAS